MTIQIATGTRYTNFVIQTVSAISGTGSFMDMVWAGISFATSHFLAAADTMNKSMMKGLYTKVGDAFKTIR